MATHFSIARDTTKFLFNYKLNAYNKSDFDECGTFNENLYYTQDYDLWFRMAQNYRFIHVAEILIHSRQHPQQCSVQSANEALKEHNNLFVKFIYDLSLGEITSLHHHTPAIAFQSIADAMWNRGLEDAGEFADNLSKEFGLVKVARRIKNIIPRVENEKLLI